MKMTLPFEQETAELTQRLYWQVGERVRHEVRLEECVGYGKQILQTLCAKLIRDYRGEFGGVFNGAAAQEVIGR